MGNETLLQSLIQGTVRDAGQAPEKVAGAGEEGGEGRDGGGGGRKRRERSLRILRSLRGRPTGIWWLIWFIWRSGSGASADRRVGTRLPFSTRTMAWLPCLTPAGSRVHSTTWLACLIGWACGPLSGR